MVLLVVDLLRPAERDERRKAGKLAGVGQRVAAIEAAHVELEARLTEVLADQGRRPLGIMLQDDDGSHGSCTIPLRAECSLVSAAGDCGVGAPQAEERRRRAIDQRPPKERHDRDAAPRSAARPS